MALSLEELEAKVKAFEERLLGLEDIEQIAKVQKACGYYLDNSLWDDMVDLFAEATESVEVSDNDHSYLFPSDSSPRL